VRDEIKLDRDVDSVIEGINVAALER